MSDLLALATSVVEKAQAGEGMEVYVVRGSETEVRAYEGSLESLTSADSSGVGIRVVLEGAEGEGSRLGFAWAGSLDPAVIEAALADARDNARYATPDPDVVLARPDGASVVEQDLWDDGVTATPMEDKIALALELERATRAADDRVRQVSSADYSDERAEMALASTTGIRSSARRTTAFVSVDAIAGVGADTQTGTGFSVGRAPADLDPDEAMGEAVQRSTRLLGAQKAQSGRYTVVFDPRVVSTLLSVMASALSGEAVVKGRSFFAGRIGESVANAAVTLVDDPTDSRAFSASTYDAEGLACRRNVLISDGMLRMFVFDTVSARRAQMQSTGSAVRGGFAGTPSAGCRALVLQPGTKGADDILASVGDGLYVQSVTGIHSGVNTVSGDFSVGAEGLMIRGGALAEPVREVTVASTLQRMLQSIVEIGGDLRWLPGSAAGQTLAIADMQLSGE
ncbi:MAG TPA: TldD/PmbA family protein [Acidimicrobiales bacterium]|jgi:PmbA protein|nr:TldD/PmbA family protein [Acidimicrobiales bacterium]